MPFRLFQRQWKLPKVVWGLFALETPLTVALLALFGIAAPNLYRKLLWQEGSDHGWNSDPVDELYAAANHNPFTRPIVWSQFMTNFNIVVSVLSMFLLLVRITMMIVHVFAPIVSFTVHALLVALYAVAIRNQTAPDLSNPEVPNHGPPWYITKSCSASSTDKIKGYCEQAKASFIVSVIMLAIFAAHLPIALYSIISAPPPKQRSSTYHPEPATPRVKQEQPWIPLSPAGNTALGFGRTPMTPRAQAYYNLGGEPRSPAPYQPHADVYQTPAVAHQDPQPFQPSHLQHHQYQTYQHHQLQEDPDYYPPEKLPHSSTAVPSEALHHPQPQTHHSPHERPYTPSHHQDFYSSTHSPTSPSARSASGKGDLPLRHFGGAEV